MKNLSIPVPRNPVRRVVAVEAVRCAAGAGTITARLSEASDCGLFVQPGRM